MAHDGECGPDCFACLVASYAQTVVVHKPLYPPKVKHGTKPSRS